MTHPIRLIRNKDNSDFPIPAILAFSENINIVRIKARCTFKGTCNGAMEASFDLPATTKDMRYEYINSEINNIRIAFSEAMKYLSANERKIITDENLEYWHLYEFEIEGAESSGSSLLRQVYQNAVLIRKEPLP